MIQQCPFCKSKLVSDINPFYVKCSNPECLLHDNFHHIKKFEGVVEMKEKKHKFEIGQEVYFIKWGKIYNGKIDQIDIKIDQTLYSTGSIGAQIVVKYNVKGEFHFEFGRKKFLAFSQSIDENRIFVDRSEAETVLRQKADDSIRVLLNSVYIPLSRIAALKKEEVVSGENYEWVKKAKKLASEIRAFNKKRYHMRTPVMMPGSYTDFMDR